MVSQAVTRSSKTHSITFDEVTHSTTCDDVICSTFLTSEEAGRMIIRATKCKIQLKYHRRVQGGGGGQGVLIPLFLPSPLFICDPHPTQPDLTDKCNVNCFLIV